MDIKAASTVSRGNNDVLSVEGALNLLEGK